MTTASKPMQGAEAIFQADMARITLRTDRMFYWLLIAQWIGAVLVALVWSPRTWIGQYWSIHQHVMAATLLGGLFAAYPLYLIRRKPGAEITRQVIAVGQMLQSALLVHVTGGRVETHFHVFGSLALLAFYRDWRVLVTGSLVVLSDHLALGAWFPLAVYGVPYAPIWRALEHGFWVIFEDVFLIMSCRKGIQELHAIADREVRLEQTAVELRRSNAEILNMSQALKEANQGLEARVADRTRELHEANVSLERHVNEMQRLTKELGRSNEELEQFAYVASHDLQEPLRMVASYIQLLAKRYQSKLDKDADEFINFAVGGVNRMRQLISDLLLYSRVGTQAKPLQPTVCDTALNEALENLQVAIKESGARVTRSPLPTLMGDGAQLTQVFQNLIGNALKFHGERPPEVEIGAELLDGQWRFRVRDHGIGLDPQYADRIFVIFQRLHTQEEYPGTGIGLTVCKKIINRHGGRIWVESKSGDGATFYFTIPNPASMNGTNGAKNTNGAAPSQRPVVSQEVVTHDH